ncbi:MAG: gliding motility-associated ABC transporter permease subunit GldF [Paludibacteraceae bacterium]|nr:gliding motility-associated ABC transporter permease subunit GldF [Paludibacteraceae bacterium]
MYSIYIKELKSFFGTATGYIVIAIFLIATGLMLWVFPGDYNIIDRGYADLEGLFALAPWLYMFLCPAVTMRMIAEERQNGTMELLVTRPLTGWDIALGKLLAGWTVVLIALLPTLVWFVSVNLLAEPQFNVDYAQFWGSWMGLLFLALVFVSVGIFSSSLSKNQIVVFILSALFCFTLYYGFELIGSLFSGNVAYTLRTVGIHEHYSSIARGVIDSRDIAYFLSVSALFAYFTKLRIKNTL